MGVNRAWARVKIVAVLLLYGSSLYADSWTRMLDFPSTGMREVVAFSVLEKGYLGITRTQEFWQFDSVTMSWSQLSDLPGINFQSPSFVVGGKAYIVSGNELWEYAPETDSWLQKGDVPGGIKGPPLQ